MNFKKTGIRINDIETIKPHFIKLEPDALERLGFKKNNAKSLNDYLIDYLGDKSLFNKFDKRWSEAINKTLPKRVKESCLFCNGKSTDDMDKKCGLYHTEASMNYTIATSEFISIIEKNKHIFKEKQTKKNLTIKFFEGFLFQDGRVFYSIDYIVMECLKEGFLSISQFFSENSILTNLEIINNSLDSLNDEQLKIMLDGHSEPIHIKPQKIFFKNKLRFFKEKHFIENEVNKVVSNEDIEKNPYPRIFITTKGFLKFKSLISEYGNTNENLVNYSYVFHRMIKDKLIFSDVKHLEYLCCLLEFEINIDRIKTFNQIGKKELRESIYNKS